MRTSVEISDNLLKRVRALMTKRGTTLRALIEEGLERVVAERAPESPKVRDAAFRGRIGFAPGMGEQDIQRAIAEFNDNGPFR